ncbi:MAG: hypothetical protein JK586_05435 [Nocardiopsis sp. BM-2018]|nr:MAG: hypothetical protein JK586_05435 [Nocardiopsis sp. BM-2018]
MSRARAQVVRAGRTRVVRRRDLFTMGSAAGEGALWAVGQGAISVLATLLHTLPNEALSGKHVE